MKTKEKTTLTTDDFDFELPKELIAQNPLKNRSDSKLLYSIQGPDKESLITDQVFSSILDLIPHDSLFVINTSKVIKARVLARTKHGGKIEIFLLKPTDHDRTWNILARPEKKLKLGKVLDFEDGSTAEVVQLRSEGNHTQIRFSLKDSQSFYSWLDQMGKVPLPPYIKRDLEKKSDLQDESRYQTVYSQQPGSVAAPTAGLHFTEEILEAAKSKNIVFAPVCLHVGLGTFSPIHASDPKNHAMHYESYQIPKKSLESILEAKRQGKKIYSVGSTSFRCVESFFQEHPITIDPSTHDENHVFSTNLFIYPKHKAVSYSPKVFDGMVTNFHLPKSTLFMLICGLLGFDRAKKIYLHAVRNRYRFFSYGDCSLLIF